MKTKSLLILSVSAFAASAFALDNPLTSDTTITTTESLTEPFTVNSGVNLNIGTADGLSAGTLNITSANIAALKNSGTITINKNGALNINVTDNTQTWKTFFESGNMNIYGSFTFTGGKGTTPNAYIMGPNYGKTLNVYSGATMDYGATGILTVSSGVMNIYEGAQVKADKITIMGQASTLKIGGNDVLTRRNGLKLVEISASAGSKNYTLDFSDTTNYTLGQFTFNRNGICNIILPSAMDGIFTLDSLNWNSNQSPYSGEILILQDFRNDTFKLNKTTNLLIQDETLGISNGASYVYVSLVAKDDQGNTIDLNDNQHWGFENGFLNIITVVPEPAEWAAIFGALALGLAIYRKRK